MRTQLTLLSAVIALSLIPGFEAGARQASAPAPQAPTTQAPAQQAPPAIPQAAPQAQYPQAQYQQGPQSGYGQQQQSYGYNQPQYSQVPPNYGNTGPNYFTVNAFSSVVLTGGAPSNREWVTDCYPAIENRFNLPNPYSYNPNVHERAIYRFSDDGRAGLKVRYQIVNYQDPFCSQPMQQEVDFRGTWTISNLIVFDPLAAQLQLVYNYCRIGGVMSGDTTGGPCLTKPKLVKIADHLMWLGHEVPGGTEFNYDFRLYIRGTAPTDFLIPVGPDGSRADGFDGF